MKYTFNFFVQILAHEDGINCVKFADTSSQILLSAADDGLCKVNAGYNGLLYFAKRNHCDTALKISIIFQGV